jgi:hypothetical protein
MQQPEGPRSKPSIAIPKCSGNNDVVQYAEQDWAVIALFDDAGQRHRQLKIA